MRTLLDSARRPGREARNLSLRAPEGKNYFHGAEKLSWPFLFVLDARGRETGWALVNGPIVTHGQQEQFAELRRRNYRFAGMSSYMTFPLLTGEEGALEYEALCEVWCHCFREPHRFFSTGIPRELISVSDFTDYMRVLPQSVSGAGRAAPFDFVYVGAAEDWKKEVKGWGLAGRCLPRLAKELGLRGLVIGEPDGELRRSPGITFSPHLPWARFLAELARAHFLFVPNELDASPKLLAEALCHNIPLVINRRILGGWKYVNAFTGVFFEDEEDAVEAAVKCLRRGLAPRDWFRANHGPYHAGRRLLRLLLSVDPGISERSHLCLGEVSTGPCRAP